MVYLVCAIYPEAKAYIEAYGLKRQDGFTSYQVYAGDTATLLLTGAGKLNACIAVTDYFAKKPTTKSDILLLLGCAGGLHDSSDLFLARAITDADSGFTYYPDILFKHAFKEARLITTSRLVDASNYSSLSTDVCEEVCFDMEASGVYTAAIRFFSCDRIICLKYISDNVTTGIMINSPEEYSVHEALAFIDKLQDLYNAPLDANDIAAPLNELATLLSASESMTHDINKYLLYLASQGIDAKGFVTSFIKDNEITAPVIRKQGKILLDAFKRAVLEL